jgi:hypothetical protein
MIAAMNDTNLQLIRAIRRRWPNPNDRAAALDISRRQLQRWELDEEVPQIICRLIELGIVTIVDPADLSDGQPPADIATTS